MKKTRTAPGLVDVEDLSDDDPAGVSHTARARVPCSWRLIRTVVVDPTFDNVIVLGLIVLIRTFLSMSLQLELDGRWPWQHDPPKVKHQGEVSTTNVRDE
jgi:Protein of unknown function (DUF1622)